MAAAAAATMTKANGQRVIGRTSTRALRQQTFQLAPDERTAVIGKTGSGKSVWVKYMLSHWLKAGWPVLIVDPKHRYVDVTRGGTYAEEPAKASLEHPFNITQAGHFREDAKVQIFLPSMPAKADPVLDKLLQEILERGGVVVDVEDIFGLADEHGIPTGLGMLWTQGRAAYVPMYVQGQRAYQIPKLMLGQSENIVIFRLTDTDDRKRLAQITGDPAVLAKLPKYHYRFFHEDMDATRRMAPLSRAEIGGR